MKNKIPVSILSTFLLCISVISCGPSEALIISQSQVERLQKDSTDTHNQLLECDALSTRLKGDNSSLKNENSTTQNDLKVLESESKLTIADQAKRLKNLQDVIQSQKDVMTKLKSSISDALMNYREDELKVYIKDGNVYVSMEEKLLFKSGSDIVDSKGKEALKSLAKVLKNTKDITVMIEGHTDDVSIKTKQFQDNWDLSTARATSIVRILTKDYSFDPERITASGKGIFHPIKSNKTAEGRSSNRRTEVILSPDMKELYKLF